MNIGKMERDLTKFLKNKRREFGLTQLECARKAGVSYAFIRNLEQGKKTVQMHKVNQVLGLFGAKLGVVNVDEFREVAIKKRTKRALERVSNMAEKYHQAAHRVKITIAGTASPYIGVIKKVIKDRVPVKRQDNIEESFVVPVKFVFEIRDGANPDNGEEVELNTFAIQDISFF